MKFISWGGGIQSTTMAVMSTLSACVCCPYRIASEWLRMREEAPQEFAEAVAFDETIRHIRPNGSVKAESLYIWKGLEPLATADLEQATVRERRGKQLPLILTACESGHCWV
ncbi:MAG TPA: hypothetical protein G4O00_14120 [Thermoflexia bacterium]|jgi:hypothetical protein|nr:hypothetical protein [Thermoflexia bacterium]